ncbi:hypothetical protein sphantq_03445 [Sphingobium sp. AntQ-1]|nr:hypothetical protein sphantq_03445 [Sphingobium sp. AntQ-1]
MNQIRLNFAPSHAERVGGHKRAAKSLIASKKGSANA